MKVQLVILKLQDFMKINLFPLGSDVGLDKSRSLSSERKSIRAEEYQDSLAPVSYIQVIFIFKQIFKVLKKISICVIKLIFFKEQWWLDSLPKDIKI